MGRRTEEGVRGEGRKRKNVKSGGNPSKVGRFQVMATLQAARASVLGMRLDEAKSWGLNRAIFYAAAKRGFRSPGGEKVLPGLKAGGELEKGVADTLGTEYLGDEYAYRVRIDGMSVFTIGGEVQTAGDFRHKIEARFGGTFRQAWKEALEICRSFDTEVLRSQRDFYSKVYKPRRDELAEAWTRATTEG